MLRRIFNKRARNDIAYCHRLLHIPYNEPEPDLNAISEIINIVSKKEVKKTKCHWRKNWQHLRKDKLTASSFSHAIGFSLNGRRDLWLEKIGAAKPFTGTRATYWDIDNEKKALKRYVELSGNGIHLPGFRGYDNGEIDWLGASPDGEIIGGASRGLLEVKCPYYDDETKAYPWTKVPWQYVPQVQGLMEIVDVDWLDLYCWTCNGSSLFRIWRDEEFWEEMKPALVDFWEKHVLPAKEIYNDFKVRDPHVKIREFRPMPCHDDCKKIMRGAERISANSNCLFYEIGGKLID